MSETSDSNQGEKTISPDASKDLANDDMVFFSDNFHIFSKMKG